MWRNPLSSLRRSNRARPDASIEVDAWERSERIVSLPVMAEIEALALTVYATHGLPTQPGHYRRGPTSDRWLYLGDKLDAGVKWAMVLEHPPEQGWRHANLEEIGRFPGAPDVLGAAARLLSTCRHLKARLRGAEPGDPGDDIEMAIRLGSEWRALSESVAVRGTSRLKLSAPSDPAPVKVKRARGGPATSPGDTVPRAQEPALKPPPKPRRSRRKPAD